MMNLLQNTGFAFSPDRSLFGPTSGDIDTVYGIGKHTGERIAAVSDGIGFQEARSGFIPLVGFQRDLFSQQGAGFGGSPPPFFIAYADGF